MAFGEGTTVDDSLSYGESEVESIRAQGSRLQRTKAAAESERTYMTTYWSRCPVKTRIDYNAREYTRV